MRQLIMPPQRPPQRATFTITYMRMWDYASRNGTNTQLLLRHQPESAWLLLASEKAVNKFNLQPMALLSPSHWAGLDPAQMGLGPVHATHALLKKHKLKFDDIDYWELNEAFAGQVLACLAAFADANYCKQELHARQAWGEIPLEKLNIHGGAVACGHPVGMTGARIVLHMVHILKQQNAQRGIATLCIGGGQGGAMMVEDVS